MSTGKQVLIGIAAAVGAALLLRVFDRARAPAPVPMNSSTTGYVDERGRFRTVTIQ